jgi:quercetin dioxygenase-like cupin family protein
MNLYHWNDIPLEQMNPRFARQALHTERITIAKLELKQGGVVPRHNHENEQVCLVVSGKLKFIFDNAEYVIGPGDVMQIAPNAPHSVEVLEDSEAYDLFAPIREDWIRGEDAYLRR